VSRRGEWPYRDQPTVDEAQRMKPGREKSVLGRCVVGVDGSDGSARAFQWAVAQAKGGAVTAVHGFSPGTELLFAALQVDLDPMRAEHVRLLEGAWIAGTDDAEVSVCTAFFDDHPARALLAVSHRNDNAPIVVGHHGHGSWSAHHVGDITTKLLRHADVPVIVTNEATRPEGLDGPILVGLNGPTPQVEAIFEWAARLALEVGLGVHIVCVSEPVPAGDAFSLYPGAGIAVDWTALHDSTVEFATQLGATFRERHPSLKVTTEARQGLPATMLDEAARDIGASLIVMGNHHHGTIASMLGAAVAGQLPAIASCPVALVPVENPTS
jgi:nucleotide-binding universal stress UspA family protein